MLQIIFDWLVKHNMTEVQAYFCLQALAYVAALVLGYVFYKIAKIVMEKMVHRLIKKTKFEWDDVFIEKKVLSRLAQIVPALILYVVADYFVEHASVAFLPEERIGEVFPLSSIIMRFSMIYLILAGVLVLDALLSSFMVIMQPWESRYKMPIGPVLQAGKVVAYIVMIILVISQILGKNPSLLITGLAGLTAVTMLIFKDTILGFVGGIQLTANDMVRRGDWITMPDFGADGDVMEITLTTVKVQNWDKTITTIPTYALVSSSFINWRGMTESGGRRVCRSVNIDMSTIRFCDKDMIAKFRKIEFISDYIDAKQEEIEVYNKEHNVDDSVVVNGRRMTNIGTFRAYVTAYLRQHPQVHQEGMTFLVRQLAPGETGLPIQIYVFLKEQRWAYYEGIQSDIFDHILAVVPEFELRVFQNPSGYDMRAMTKTMTGGDAL
ncbi:MAG: mechanosensitive ion channel family protein [Candidatus Sumerlaeota bacterium]